MSIPNYITCFRILLVPFFFTALLSYEPGKENMRWLAFALFLLGSLSDALDGMIARATKSRTALGRFLDPLADKLLLLSGFVGILFVDALIYHPPLWVTVTIIFRDIIILTGLLIIFIVTGSVDVRPNFLGKCTTACQMVTLLAILLMWKIAIPFWYITAILTMVSLLTYMVRGVQLLTRHE